MSLNAFLEVTFIFRFFPVLKFLTELAPLFARRVSEDVRSFLVETNERMPARVRKAKEDHQAGIIHDRPSIFAAIMESLGDFHE